jgi:hypothetical protein
LIRSEFARQEKKTVYLEGHDLRLQMLRGLAAWLPKEDLVPFLIAVDSDVAEAPAVRFRAAVLLCERGDDPLSSVYLRKRHLPAAEKIKPLLSVDELRNAFRDRQRFESAEGFASLPSLPLEEITRVQKGVQVAQYLHGYKQGEEVRQLSVSKVIVKQQTMDSLQFALSTQSEGWRFELRRKGDQWLPTEFEMVAIR